MEVEGTLDGPARHQQLDALVHEWHRNAKTDPKDKGKSFAHGMATWPSVSPRTRARVDALVHTWKTLDLQVVSCHFPSGHALETCPKYLFTLGTLPKPTPLLCAAFNSRKGKHTCRRDSWVEALRQAFDQNANQPVGWVSSLGTPVYDLTSCWAHRQRKLVVLVAIPSRTRPAVPEGLGYFPSLKPSWILCCLPGRPACSPARYAVCRDRLVAAIADQFFVLAVRREGNLFQVLSDELKTQSKPTWVFCSAQESPETEGNRALLHSFSHCTPLRLGKVASFAHGHRREPLQDAPHTLPFTESGFLYHYTRSCPGPWPGQTRCEWAEDLLQNRPWADHTALDTLWHILWERRLRASGRLIRQGIPVVSWTQVAPLNLSRLTRWNPALIRWTFEPYGVAVRKDVLKRLGAKPVIYASDKDFAKIAPKDRFRFQLHRPGQVSWKVEKEWRLPRDLLLDALAPDTWWAFVPTAQEARQLEENLGYPCRIVPLTAFSTTSSDRRKR
ncbi:hypothetical protein EDC27_1314 [Desulfosoma caldarium]|uniref:Uncharacterized protein n=2 Tax=Desulfosoma caldarium TaxID=610254 RepID=A0A3N1UX86_9BACT|nr:hypothetical protein EDC27_1314 [Desulfosoma caldarium]